MQLKITLIIFLSILIFGCTVKGQENSSNPSNSNCNCDKIDPFGKWFLLIAGSAGIMEVELGKLASERSSRADVKEFAIMMVDEHTEINKEYRELLTKNCLTPPTKMFPDNQKLYDSLKADQNNIFDRDYIQVMINDHGMAVHWFEQAYQNANDKEIKTWLGRMRDIVCNHYNMAVKLQEAEYPECK